MTKREDSKQTLQELLSVRKEQGRENTVIQKIQEVGKMIN